MTLARTDPYVITLELPYEAEADVWAFWAFLKPELCAEGLTPRDGMTVTWENPAAMRVEVKSAPGVNVSDAVRRALQDAPTRPVKVALGQAVPAND